MNKILLIKRGAMGDILMTTPLIRQLRQNFPDSQIDYCLAKPFESTLLVNPNLNNIIVLDDSTFSPKGAYKFIKFAMSMRNKYDYVFMLGKHWYFNLMSRIMGATTIGYKRDILSKLVLDKSVKYNDVTRYHSLYYLDLLAVSGLARPNYSDIKLDLSISETDKVIVTQKLSNLNIDKYIVVVNSGGNNQYEIGGIRMLPDDKIIQLIQGLLDNGYKIILLGGNQDTVHYDTYLDELNYPDNLFNLAGEFNLRESAWLIKSCEHFYTTDCGAMHFGVAMQIFFKMTAFFGPTNPRHIIPLEYITCTVWNDEAIYDPNYQLNGYISSNPPKYFMHLDIAKYIIPPR
jgi:ADP-heptose:LPS heptosyltransferase